MIRKWSKSLVANNYLLMNRQDTVADNIVLPRQIAPGDRSQLSVEIAYTLNELERHGNAWNRLAFESRQALPMLSCAWVASYLEYQVESGESWFCLFAYDNSELVGVLPVVITFDRMLGIKRRILRTPYDYHTRSVDFLCRRGREKEVISLFVSHIDCIRPAVFSLQLRHLPASSPSLPILAEGVEGVISVCDLDGYGCYIRIKGSYDEIRKQLGPRFNRNLGRLERKLASLRDVEVSFLTGRSATEKELTHFMQIETSGWKGGVGTAISQSPSLVSFYTSLVRRMAELGWLEWHLLHAKEKVIAAHLAIRINRSLVILKITYDESYSSYSPGHILFERTIKWAFASGEIDEIDCLTNYPWNRKWLMERKTYHNLHIFPRRPFPIIAGVAPLKVRAIARRVPFLRPLCRLLRNLARGS